MIKQHFYLKMKIIYGGVKYFLNNESRDRKNSNTKASLGYYSMFYWCHT